MLSLGYALLGFTLGGICKEMDPFQQGFPSCVTNLYPNGSTNPCSERYSYDTDGDGGEVVSVVSASFLPQELSSDLFSISVSRGKL